MYRGVFFPPIAFPSPYFAAKHCPYCNSRGQQDEFYYNYIQPYEQQYSAVNSEWLRSQEHNNVSEQRITDSNAPNESTEYTYELTPEAIEMFAKQEQRRALRNLILLII